MKGNIVSNATKSAIEIEFWYALNRAGFTFSPEELPQKMRQIPVEDVVRVLAETHERINAWSK